MHNCGMLATGMHTRRGFTLIELLVVIGIVGLLSTMAIVAMSTGRAKARDTRRTSDIRSIQTALELFRPDVGGYPFDTVAGAGGAEIGAGGLAALVRTGWQAAPPAGVRVYLTAAPRDPVGHQYLYQSLQDDGSACDTSPCDTYSIQFDLELGTGALDAGTYCAQPPGTISAGAC